MSCSPPGVRLSLLRAELCPSDACSQQNSAGFPRGSLRAGAQAESAYPALCKTRARARKSSRRGIFRHVGARGFLWHPLGRPHGHAAGSPFLPAVRRGCSWCPSPGGRAGITAPDVLSGEHSRASPCQRERGRFHCPSARLGVAVGHVLCSVPTAWPPRDRSSGWKLAPSTTTSGDFTKSLPAASAGSFFPATAVS